MTINDKQRFGEAPQQKMVPAVTAAAAVKRHDARFRREPGASACRGRCGDAAGAVTLADEFRRRGRPERLTAGRDMWSSRV